MREADSLPNKDFYVQRQDESSFIFIVARNNGEIRVWKLPMQAPMPQEW
jgi:hypothetical protein